MKKYLNIFICIIFFCILTLDSVTQAKEMSLQQDVSGEDVLFNINARNISLVYSRTQNQADYVFFQDEPIYFDIFLRNETKQTIPISAKGSGWWDFISMKLFINNNAIPTDKFSIISTTSDIKENQGPGVAQNLSELYPGELIKRTVRPSLNGSFRIPPGIYKLELYLNPSRLGNKFPHSNRQLPAIISFEIREVKNKGDLLDYNLHQAIRSRWNKEYPQAFNYLRKMIVLNPNSISAHIELGRIQCEQGKTQEAIQSFEVAIKSLQTKSDIMHVKIALAMNVDDSIRYIRRLIYSCGRR
jgi:tetratricopeptide (TPR) repeat protein